MTSVQFDFLSTLGYRAALSVSEELTNNTARLVVDTSLRAAEGETVHLENASTYRYRDVLGDDDSDGYRAVTREIDSGLTVDLTGVLHGDRTISVEISVGLSKNGTDMSGNGNPPPTSRKQIETKVTIASGEAVVVGGLLQREESLAEHRFPPSRTDTPRAVPREWEHPPHRGDRVRSLPHRLSRSHRTGLSPGDRPAHSVATARGGRVTMYRSDFCRLHGVAYLDEDAYTVRVGAWRPLRRSVIEALAMTHGKRISVERIASTSPEAQLAIGEPVATHDVAPPLSRDRVRNLSNVEDFLRRIVVDAATAGASDISIWETENLRWNVSRRVAGEIATVAQIDRTTAERIIGHLLVRSGLDTFDPNTPQDGIVRFPWLPEYRIRVAFLPDRVSRSLALRFLRRVSPELSTLGYTGDQVSALVAATSHRSGLVLFAGPTGSGKTTSIASLITHLVGPNGGDHRKFISIEDPIEYRVPGVVQIERVGEDASGSIISAALRQDPDVLVFGEVRRPDQALHIEGAVLSGHTVVTSVHADGVEGTYRRLAFLGITPTTLERYCRAVCVQSLLGSPPRLFAQIESDPWRHAV
jgi:type II secretory ATPase GspE/PulE/Tfp pilus assembly ATPase PilB-like protein